MTNTQAEKLEIYLKETCSEEISFPTPKSKLIMLEMLNAQDICLNISLSEALDLINYICEVAHG